MDLKALRLGTALQLVIRTLPILLVRLGVNLLFWLIYLLYLGITGGLSFLVGKAIPAVGVILFLVALGGMFPLYRLAQRYVLFLIKAAHIAVMSELLANGELPPGTNQLAWGKERVQKRFGQVNVMFLIDELVAAVLRAFTRAVYTFASWLPGGLFRNLAQVINRIIHYSLSYVDEAILARSFWSPGDNVWANARDGLVLYGMVWKPLLLNAIALMVLSYIPFILVLILFSAPIGGLASLISSSLAGWSIIATLALALLIKAAVGDSFAMAAMIAAYHYATAELQPDPQVSAQLERISDKFGDLKRRAEEEFGRLGRAPTGGQANLPSVPA